jgi:hypothetical protein
MQLAQGHHNDCMNAPPATANRAAFPEEFAAHAEADELPDTGDP